MLQRYLIGNKTNMFERVVATILHRYLGKYIQDLDTENLNVGIFGGDVQLSELKVKPDALYELDLPLEVKVGTIGRIRIKIPWGCFNKQSIIIEIEEVYIIASPITDRGYDPEKEKRLMRASKKRKLELLENGNLLGSDAPESPTFIENLITTIMNNLQVFIHNIHIRYEDSSMRDIPLACGICLQSISIETTNSKWKPTAVSPSLPSVYQMIKLDSFSVYCNPTCTELVGKDPGQDSAAPYTWRNDMKRGLETFSVKGEEFEFIIKPISAKMKVIINKSNEARVPKLLVDFVLQDAATQLSRLQYLALIELAESFERINIKRKYLQYHPGKSLSGNAKLWWKYSYESVLEQRIRPYTWARIAAHRANYKNYCEIYKQTLLNPTDTELKLDLQQSEDLLSITDIIIAREHTKIMMLKEDSEKINVYKREDFWWRNGFDSKTYLALQVVSGKGRGLWAQLSPSEKSTLYEAIGYAGDSVTLEKPKQYIEHKINFTLANCSLSLLKRGHEVLVFSLAQFLASIETRPAARAFKLSARVESFLIEGASVEHDLVPIITADSLYTGNTSSNFLSIDFIKNPSNSEADYGLTVNLEQIEIIYHEHAVSEFISFLKTADKSLSQTLLSSSEVVVNGISTICGKVIRRSSAFDINLDLKLPYFVIPELGTLQKGGNLSIIDLGHIKVSTELQPSNINLDDATQMEIEERLYDRFHLDFLDIQVLFCDSGDLWRDAKKMNDSEFHLLPKLQFQLAFSNSVKPEYKLLPRHKLNIGLTSLKVNISDRKIGSFMDFLDNLPLPTVNTVHVSSSVINCLSRSPDFANDEFMCDPSINQLNDIKNLLVESVLNKLNKPTLTSSKSPAKIAMLQVDKSFISVEHSDEETEQWARTVDLPGFDDNVSPNNIINILLRFMVGEIVIQLCRSCNRIDKPYLMLRITNICFDAAIMEYGPAVQASIGSVQLIDKLHTGLSGEYLELFATETGKDVATLLYRIVRSDCPDFKTHFHNVEHSLVLDFSSACVVVHREAFVTLNKYAQYLLQKINNREIVIVQNILDRLKNLDLKDRINFKNDTPIPPGATKFSYSTRLHELWFKFCDTDIDFMDVKICGVESDCLFKANERMVLQFYISRITVDDLSQMTLYPKVISVEDEKVIHFKYIRHSPRFYKNVEIETNKDDVKSDGSLKVRIGRLHVVVITKMIIDLQNFIEPLIRPELISSFFHAVGRSCKEKISSLQTCGTRLHLALDVHTPSFFFPQKVSSPNLIIVSLGDLVIENFFKEKSAPVEVAEVPVIDNILIRLNNIQVCRSVMTLTGTLQAQEPIIEPFSIKMDVKRAVNYNDMKAVTMLIRSSACRIYPQTNPQILLYELEGVIDTVRINIGQCDLSTIISIWLENFNSGTFLNEIYNNWASLSCDAFGSPAQTEEDQAVRKLQAFFSQEEHVRKETSARFTLDSIELFLFNDSDEILSSPVRDLNQGLCKLELSEILLSLDVFSDKSLEMKITLQTCLLEDIRKETEPEKKKIFQSHCGSLHPEKNSNISISTPPIVDVTFKQTQSGQKSADLLIEHTRLSLSVSFILEFTKFILDSFPPDKYFEGGLINHGYIGDSNIQVKQVTSPAKAPTAPEPPCNNVYMRRTSCFDEQSGISISLQFRRPEIILYSSTGHSLLLRTEILLDYSRHSGRESFVFSASGVHIFSKFRNPHKINAPYAVLHPCDFEFAKYLKSNESGVKITSNFSPVDIHITPNVIQAINTVISEFSNCATEGDTDNANITGGMIDLEDLWSPKKMSSYTVTPSAVMNSSQSNDSGTRIKETFIISVPKVRILFELEGMDKKTPLILLKLAAEAAISNWSSSFQLKGEIRLQGSYFNCQVGAWEPLIEPAVEEEGVYRPVEIQVKIFKSKAYPIQPRYGEETNGKDNNCTISKLYHSLSSNQIVNSEDSETSADEHDHETCSMTFIRRRQYKSEHGKSKHESISLISYPEDSDSDNEEGVMEKLAGAISHLFTGDSSEGDASDSNDSSGAEPSPDTDEESAVESVSGTITSLSGKDARPVLIKKRSDSVDSGLETEGAEKDSTYVIFEASDRIEINVTPQSILVLTKLHTALTNPASLWTENVLILINDIMPNSNVTLLSNAEEGPATVIMSSSYEHSDSLPSSPASSNAPTDFFSPLSSDVDMDYFEGRFNTKLIKEYSSAELLSPYMKFPIETISRLYKKITDQRLRLKITGFEDMEILCPQRTCNKLHMLQPIKNSTRYYIILSVTCHEWGQKILLRSPLQIRNETSYAIALYYKKSILEGLNYSLIGESTNPFEDTNRIAIIEPDEIYNVPLIIAHHCRLYFQPAHFDNYSISEVGLWWQDMATDLNIPKDVLCPAKEEKDPTVFSVRVVCEDGVPSFRSSKFIPKYLIRLLPSLSFHNRLPIAVEIKIPSIHFEVRIEAGENTNIYYLNLLKGNKIIVSVPSYLGILWSGYFNLSPEVEEKIVSMTTEQETEGGNKQLGLNIKVERRSLCEVILYAPYWIINKTGLPLQIRASLTDCVYEARNEELLLFCYRKQRKQCIRVRAYHSSWSSAFSIDAFCTSGLVICKDRERKRKYRILLKIDLADVCPQLTKIVTFLPNFIVFNECKKPLRFMEENEKADLWIDLSPSQSTAFWPETEKMNMLVKFRDSKVVSQHFPITRNHETVLRMDRGGGLCVIVSGGGNRPFSIVFRPYRFGDAPVRVDNLCEDLFLKIHQQQLGQVALLSPYQTMLYTWDDPCKERFLLWNVYNKKSKDYIAEIWKDGYGQERVSFHMIKKQQSAPSAPTVTAKLSASFKRLSTSVPNGHSSSSGDTESDDAQKTQLTKKTRKDKVTVYWVSYFEGLQRVLMFTQDERIAYKARLKIDAEKSYLELFASIKGFGLSLASNEGGKLKEIAYLSIRDSAPIWEVSVAHRWKPMTLELAAWLEDKWKHDSRKAQMKEFVHVDFEKMQMTKPFYGELRRRYSSALWVQYRRSQNFRFFLFKVHHLQIENQMPNAVYPVAVYPKPLPYQIMKKFSFKPCIEFTCLRRHEPTQNADVYKHIKLIIQEFFIQCDENFVLGIFGTLPMSVMETQPCVRIRNDISVLHQPISNWCVSSNEPKVAVEYLHISPISLNISFIFNGVSLHQHVCKHSFKHDLLFYIFDTLVPSHPEIKGVNLKTTYYERKGIVTTKDSQINEIISHYWSQILPQLHVLIFRLDILGNPYSPVTNFTEGVEELYYDPSFYHGESSEEFNGGLLLAAQMLIGHVRGGTGNNCSLITAGLTEPNVALNFNDDYKKRRKLCLEQMSDLPHRILSHSKTFEVGIALGMSGLILKHQTGMPQQDGNEVFFRSIGKGLMGLVTKPTGSVSDCLAMVSYGIKRASEAGDEFVLRTRQPRHMDQYLGLKPFSPYEAAGKQLLSMMNKGYFADYDVYWVHAPLNPDGKSFLLVTLHHVFLIEKCRMWGTWEVEWNVRIDDIMAVPTITNEALLFKVRQEESYSYLNGTERYIVCKDNSVLQWLQQKIEAVMIVNMEDKPCPVIKETEQNLNLS
ncbi:intermembrane lipid transfer protein VPS13A-like isoform X2 [Rhodnius prolixus]|uniref:intermembrane lipid transfer protein VPS13A-like isoform X2 n=1 Tax=Rhodnius prolixus TaxID=13249 RepID=UPI003D18D021